MSRCTMFLVWASLPRSALAEARAFATAELCRLTGLDPAAEFDVSEFDGKEFDRIEDLFDVKGLAALVSSWTQADPAVVAAYTK